MNHENWKQKTLAGFRKFEMAIVLVLALLMAVVVLVSTFELCLTIIGNIFSPPYFQLGLDQLLEIFGLFLMILLGLELLETVKAYLREDVFHVEVVMVVAIIAIARKVIILDIKNLSGDKLIGLALIIASLSGGYYFLKKLYPPSIKDESAPDKKPLKS